MPVVIPSLVVMLLFAFNNECMRLGTVQLVIPSDRLAQDFECAD